jgi:hypothetical protein
MFTSFILNPLALSFSILLFHLVTAAPKSSHYDLRRRQSALPSYVHEYGENIYAQGGDRILGCSYPGAMGEHAVDIFGHLA